MIYPRLPAPPGPKGDPGEKGDPGVVTEPQPDGSLEIQPTEHAEAPPAVALPVPPAEGIYDLRSVHGALTWVPVVEEEV